MCIRLSQVNKSNNGVGQMTANSKNIFYQYGLSTYFVFYYNNSRLWILSFESSCQLYLLIILFSPNLDDTSITVPIELAAVYEQKFNVCGLWKKKLPTFF